MKVSINENLEVRIIPENALESIALRVWCEDYFKRKPKQASLIVETVVVEKDKNITVEYIKDSH